MDLQSTHAVIADKAIRETRGNPKCCAHAVRPRATLKVEYLQKDCTAFAATIARLLNFREQRSQNYLLFAKQRSQNYLTFANNARKTIYFLQSNARKIT